MCRYGVAEAGCITFGRAVRTRIVDRGHDARRWTVFCGERQPIEQSVDPVDTEDPAAPDWAASSVRMR